MKTEERRKLGEENREWGKEAEKLASEYFITEGYVVRERNWTMGRYEIDLILEKNRTIIFVEVKARRKSTEDAIDAVNSKKRRRIITAADIYLRNLPILYQYRFDIVTFTGSRENYTMEHYADAYLPPVNGSRR